MSHHGHGYRIYPDDKTNHSQHDWIKADDWIGGMKFKKDWNEALALAKLGAVNCRFPFVVMQIPTGGARQKLCDYWVIDIKNSKTQT